MVLNLFLVGLLYIRYAIMLAWQNKKKSVKITMPCLGFHSNRFLDMFFYYFHFFNTSDIVL